MLLNKHQLTGTYVAGFNPFPGKLKGMDAAFFLAARGLGLAPAVKPLYCERNLNRCSCVGCLPDRPCAVQKGPLMLLPHAGTFDTSRGVVPRWNDEESDLEYDVLELPGWGFHEFAIYSKEEHTAKELEKCGAQHMGSLIWLRSLTHGEPALNQYIQGEAQWAARLLGMLACPAYAL